MTVVLASRNQHKITEVQRILAPLQVDVVGLEALPVQVPEIAETGATFADNALIKARTVAQLANRAAIADDSGLCVSALNDMPGIFSARWSGQHGNDEANLELVLAQLRDVPVDRRQAAFVCVVAYSSPTGTQATFEGRVEGTLTFAPRGDKGFGYDPIFVPRGMTITTAELPSADKDQLSHRGIALRAFAREYAAGKLLA